VATRFDIGSHVRADTAPSTVRCVIRPAPSCANPSDDVGVDDTANDMPDAWTTHMYLGREACVEDQKNLGV
jgi:hypothetical protein